MYPRALECQDAHGDTPLHLLFRHGNPAEFKVCEIGKSLIEWAVFRVPEASFKLNAHGDTPLHVAVTRIGWSVKIFDKQSGSASLSKLSEYSIGRVSCPSKPLRSSMKPARLLVIWATDSTLVLHYFLSGP